MKKIDKKMCTDREEKFYEHLRNGCFKCGNSTFFNYLLDSRKADAKYLWRWFGRHLKNTRELECFIMACLAAWGESKEYNRVTKKNVKRGLSMLNCLAPFLESDFINDCGSVVSARFSESLKDSECFELNYPWIITRRVLKELKIFLEEWEASFEKKRLGVSRKQNGMSGRVDRFIAAIMPYVGGYKGLDHEKLSIIIWALSGKKNNPESIKQRMRGYKKRGMIH